MNRTLAIIILFVILLMLAVWYFAKIFLYLTLSIVLATVLRPMTNQISRLEIFGGRLPRFVAIVGAYMVVVAVFTLFVLLFVPLIYEQIGILSEMDFNLVFDSLMGPLRSVEAFLIRNNLADRDPGFLTGATRGKLINFIEGINVTEIINSLISFTGSFFISILAVTFITFFLLYEEGFLRRYLGAFIPNQYFEVFVSALHKIEKLLSNYLIGILFQMIAIFSLASIGLSILGINYAVTIAVFAAVANLIPYLGPLVGGAFGIVVAISTSGNLTFGNGAFILVIKVFSVFAIVQAIDNIVLQPLIFSKSIKAHPLEIFVVIFVGATIAGITGMIVAIPVYTVIRVSSAEIYTGFNQYRVFKSKT